MENPDITLTLYFGDAEKGADNAPPDDSVFLEVSGEDVMQSNVGRGFGPRYGNEDIANLQKRSGIATDKLHEGLGNLHKYRIHSGLLQYKMFMKNTGTYEWLTVIPEGKWRSVPHGVEKRHLSLRKYIVLLYHCTALGPHRGRDRTMQAILEAGLWWKNLYNDVQGIVKSCLVCLDDKSQPLVTGHQRSREYDGPFRYLMVDFVGPITPTSERGYKYVFTCTCPWSGWYWAIPCKGDDAKEAAHCLFYHVICDIAGYPCILGSDRGSAFTSELIQSLVAFFDIKHILGTPYHPQSQAAVERPHRDYNSMLKTYCNDEKDWDLCTHVFVWTIRTTAKVANQHFTPYEIITGMKPRSPMDVILAHPVGVERVSKSEYVDQLVKYLKNVHQQVTEYNRKVKEDTQDAKYRQLGFGVHLKVGDFVLVRCEPEKGTSRRMQRKHHPGIFQVVHVMGNATDPDAKSYTVSNLVGQTDGLGFQQPVPLERLTPIEVQPLIHPSEDSPTRLAISHRGEEKTGTVQAQAIDGNVYILFDGDSEPTCIDLTQMQYRWI